VRPHRRGDGFRLATASALMLIAAACGPTAPTDRSAPSGVPTPEPSVAPTGPSDERATGTDGTASADGESEARERPEWLGTRVLPLATDGFGERLPTPPELVDRRLVTPPPLAPTPPPPSDGSFRGTIEPVPDGVVARSTWDPGCPVARSELRYLTVTFIGFDTQVHTGELMVHQEVAEDVLSVFAALHAARFPLEEVRIIDAPELVLPPTGDGNVTSAFVCRPTVGGNRWSEHAYGRAVDINPFHNPYVRGDLVLPELAGAYVDRSTVRPGMIVPGDAVTAAFAAIGWGWGGDWTGNATDPMHFSTSGR